MERTMSAAFSLKTNSFIPQTPPSPYGIPNEDELLLGIKALGLCTLTYNNRVLMCQKLIHNAAKGTVFRKTLSDELIDKIHTFCKDEVELSWIRAANIIEEEYTLWNDTWKRPIQEEYLESQCMTGVIDMSPTPDQQDLVPFVAFRGSVSAMDWLRDAKSAIAIPYHTRKRTPTTAMVGKGFAEMLAELMKEKTITKELGDIKSLSHGHSVLTTLASAVNLLDEVERLVKKYDNGLIITGHSLGGGCANIFLLEFMTDYRALIDQYKEKIRMVIFGSPRAVDTETSRAFDRLPITFLRFVNNDDLITDLPPKSMKLYKHAGKTFYPYFSTNIQELQQSLDPLKSLKDWDTVASHSIWMTVCEFFREHNTVTGIEDFAADAKSDPWFSNYQWFPFPNEFAAKGFSVHTAVGPTAYSRCFQNMSHMVGATPRQQAIAQIAKSYMDVKEDTRKKLDKEFNFKL